MVSASTSPSPSAMHDGDRLDRVGDGLPLRELFVVDLQPDHAFAELALDRFHELDQRVVVGVEVVAQV